MWQLKTIQFAKCSVHSIIFRRFSVGDFKLSTKRASKQFSVKENESFMANIFRRSLVPKQVFPYPDVLSLEQKESTCSLIGPFERFFSEINDAAQSDESGKVDEKILSALWELGAFALQVPPNFGGLGLNNTQYGRLCEIVGANDLGLGITIGAHQSIGFKGILLYGTPEQKEKYLPKVSTEHVYAAFALTEPSSGSDAGSIRSRAVKSDDKKYYVLNGSKIWISNGGIADIMTVFAQTELVDLKTGEKKDKVTAFIVERSFGGVTNGPPEKKMGIKASNTAEVYFEDVKIPIENILGKEGDGFKVAMNILNNGRFGMGATLSGTMKKCIEIATSHANNRVQFGQKLKNYGSIQEKLAQMSILQYATESMAFTISQNMDNGSQDYHLEAAISKIYASESAWYVCDEAIQILGGMGFMVEAGLERVLRDLRIFRIFEGTNDILRLFIALTGIQYAGSHLKELQSAFKNPSANLGLIFKEASKRAASKVGLGGCDLSSHVAPELQPYAKKTEECIDLFGQSVEVLLLRYNKNIVNEQFILNRLANAAIDIYSMVVTQSRSSRALNLNLPTAQHEVYLTKALTIQASERAMKNITTATSRRHQNLTEKFSIIARTVCEKDGVYSTGVIEV
ncbi:very long-chain specific acyl-CoA dehydrogenase, mitochondrial isoform X1 [Drosophila miranda]|uniref:very long-chain specific acyl-CoA dehydrogenase, mitochondrial isoform X1 n=1 Tax=Drosophila miranda TaxID=7229 RepID=UPI00143F4296|nr:very long-chain specific acyl-CoA dehydrogenase, mitochondrial isoform X1 [Drosophila miranda]